MRTGLVRKYGYRNTVPQYIKVVLMHHKCSKQVGEIALRMYNRVAQNTSFSGRYPSMLAMTIVNLASKECYEDIPTAAWSGYDTCAYPALLRHSKELKKILEKMDEFPNLKRRVVGR